MSTRCPQPTPRRARHARCFTDQTTAIVPARAGGRRGGREHPSSVSFVACLLRRRSAPRSSRSAAEHGHQVPAMAASRSWPSCRKLGCVGAPGPDARGRRRRSLPHRPARAPSSGRAGRAAGMGVDVVWFADQGGGRYFDYRPASNDFQP